MARELQFGHLCTITAANNIDVKAKVVPCICETYFRIYVNQIQNILNNALELLLGKRVYNC